MNQNHHKEVYDQEDEILLKDALLFLFNSKWIILGITSLISTISIVYVMTITPIYKATLSVYPPSDLSISKINNNRFQEKAAEQYDEQEKKRLELAQENLKLKVTKSNVGKKKIASKKKPLTTKKK